MLLQLQAELLLHSGEERWNMGVAGIPVVRITALQ
jgi:hypothetical protein